MIEIELTYWGLLKHLIDGNSAKFNKKHPGIRLRSTGDATNYPEYLTNRFGSGKSPDFFQSFNEPNSYFLWKGWAGVLEDTFPEARKYKKDLLNEQYLKSLLTPDGRVQSLIYYGAHAAFMYNKDHLQGEEAPKEWEEVVSQSLKIKKNGKTPWPIALGISGPGYFEAMYAIMLGMNPSQKSYLFDEDFNPLFDDRGSPLFVALRWLSDAANKHKILTKDSVRLGAFDATYAMGQFKHTFSWLPRYVMPVIDYMSMSRTVSQALNPGYGYTSCYTRVYSPTTKALKRDSKGLEALWKCMQFICGRTNEDLDPDPKGEYRMLKSMVIDCGVPSPAKGLWRDEEVNEAMGKWGPLAVLKEQDKKVYNAQCDPWPAPWLHEWANEWGRAPLKSLLHSVIENQTSDEELLSGLHKLAGKWKTLKREYAKGP